MQTLSPISTLTLSLWSVVGAGTKHEAAAADDGDTSYIASTTGGSQVQALGLGSGTDPVVHTGHVLRMVYRRLVTTGNVRPGLQLYQGGVAITDVERAPAATSDWQTFDYTLSEAEAGAITDYSALVLHVVSPAPLVQGFEVRVTLAELRIPDYSEALVAWTLGEGAADAVADALTAGMSAKLDELDTYYGDLTLPDIATVYRNRMSIDDGVQSFPALAVYAVGGLLPVLNDGGHADGAFTVVVKALCKNEDKTVLQRQSYRYLRAAAEVLVEAFTATDLDGWNLHADTMQLGYADNEFTDSEWASDSTLTLALNKLEAK